MTKRQIVMLILAFGTGVALDKGDTGLAAFLSVAGFVLWLEA
jgi:hypothetical protein